MPVELRPAVQWFAEQVELALRRNDHKGEWSWEREGRLLELMRVEIHEVEEACVERAAGWRVIEECADVAAFALFVADGRRRVPSKDRGRA